MRISTESEKGNVKKYNIRAPLLESRWKCWSDLYFALISAMIGGRIVWDVVFAFLCGISGEPFSFGVFLTSAVINAVPGMMIQIIFVPALVKALYRGNLIPAVEKDILFY